MKQYGRIIPLPGMTDKPEAVSSDGKASIDKTRVNYSENALTAKTRRTNETQQQEQGENPQ